MRSLFSGYYTPTEEEFKQLWSECIFVFDTNTLLNLYRYDKNTRDLLLKVMNLIKDRIWIPHQIALEYHKHMQEEIHNQNNTYQDIKDDVSKTVEQLKNGFSSKRHSNINFDIITTILDEARDKITTELEAQEQNQPDLGQIMNQITTLLENKIGDAYSQIKLNEIFSDGLKRFENKIPPGFKDAKEKENQKTLHNGLIYEDKFGDIIFWSQILDISKKESTRSVILVTDDNKEDWVLKIKGKKQGPHPELIHEFKRESGGKLFYLYNTEQFLKFAVEFLELRDASSDVDEAINNVKSTKEQLQEIRNQKLRELIYNKSSHLNITTNKKIFHEYKAILNVLDYIDSEYEENEFIQGIVKKFVEDFQRVIGVAIRVSVERHEPRGSIVELRFTSPVIFDRDIVLEVNYYIDDLRGYEIVSLDRIF